MPAGRVRRRPLSLAESLESLTQPLLILRRHLAPLLEPLPRFGPFIGIHVRPLPRPVPQPFLTVRGEWIPALIEFLQQLLLCRRLLGNPRPGSSRRSSGPAGHARGGSLPPLSFTSRLTTG